MGVRGKSGRRTAAFLNRLIWLTIRRRAGPWGGGLLSLSGLLALVILLGADGPHPTQAKLPEQKPGLATISPTSVESIQAEPACPEDASTAGLKGIPQRGEKGPEGESGEIEGHAAWRWHLMTYPKKSIPPHPMTSARKWVEEHVSKGSPWGPLEEACRAEGVITTGTGAWTPVGPRPIDTTFTNPTSSYQFGKTTGRFNAIAVDPRSYPFTGNRIVYAGAAAGGLWKSVDCCGPSTAWTPLWEGGPSATQAVGAIEIDPNDPDIVYVGTGDPDAGDQFGEGIMKSTDGGTTWFQLGASIFTPFAAGTPLWADQNVGVIEVDPNNGSTVLAGTTHDLYISHDGGRRWTRCPFGANPTDPSSAGNPVASINRISGIVLDPTTQPTTAYVAVGWTNTKYNGDNGVYVGTLSTLGAPNLTLSDTGWPSGTGNGTNGGSYAGGSDVCRISLSSSRGNLAGTLTIYAQVESPSGGALGTWVTRNGGVSWTQLAGSDDGSYRDCLDVATNENQDWYDLFIQADPSSDRTVYIGRTNLYKGAVDAAYGSMTLTNLSHVYSKTCPNYGALHPDQHGAAWIGGTSQFVVANDGGLYTVSGGGTSFTPLNGTINATEFYAGQVGPDLAGSGRQIYFGGCQDNGAMSWDSDVSVGGDQTWQARGNGGDGFFAAFDPVGGLGPLMGMWYSEYVNGTMNCSNEGAGTYGITYADCFGPWVVRNPNGSLTYQDRVAWSAPFKLDARHCTDLTCSNLVFGAAHLYASTQGGWPTWVQASPDLAGGGSGHIISVDVSPTEPGSVATGSDVGTVWVSRDVFTGANCTQAAANTSAFTCDANPGASWTDLTSGNAVLPNRAIMGVAFDSSSASTLYAAVGGFGANTPSTPGHIFMVTTADQWATFTWTDKTGNLPDVPFNTVICNPNNANQVFAGSELGFFYTSDITSFYPTWTSYPYGLPATVVQHLALDRGPLNNPYASTTLTAFTYGRGAYSIRLPSGGAGFDPRPVASLKAAKIFQTPSVQITYDITCGNPNHNVYYGALGNYTAVTGAVCGIGNSGGTVLMSVPDNTWFVITGSDGSTTIGPFGTDSQGNPEHFTGWDALGNCAPKNQVQSVCP